MRPDEIEALRKAADEIWDTAKRLETKGMIEVALMLKNVSTSLHDMARGSKTTSK